MGKRKGRGKKARQEKRELEAAERAEAARRGRNRRLVIAAVPLVTGGLSAASWWGFDMPSVAGAILLGGAIVWLLVGLGYLGSGVRPRDRSRAGSIDYGTRRR